MPQRRRRLSKAALAGIAAAAGVNAREVSIERLTPMLEDLLEGSKRLKELKYAQEEPAFITPIEGG